MAASLVQLAMRALVSVLLVLAEQLESACRFPATPLTVVSNRLFGL